MMEEDPSALDPGTLISGRFRVVRCLGMGGMGAVYEIEHELTKHRRALKLLHAQMTQIPGVVERFLREASAAGRVGNPHIVETFDAGTLDTGEPYLVMEILRGETLSDRIARGNMSVADIVDLIGQACEGVQAAHDAGIVHRDLKPDNLFILDVDGRSFVKILDFGISKFDPGKTGGLALTQEGAALGTPYYMSPEQIRGETSLDARADVYALGVILYECVAGRRPFDADILTHLAVLIHAGNAAPLTDFRKDLPDGFADVIKRAMATDKNQRTVSAAQLRAELARYGSIAFGNRAPASAVAVLPTNSKPPPSQAVGAQFLATSAAGVSMRTPPPASKKSQLGPILAGFGVLGVVAIGAVFALKSGGTPAPEPVAAPAAPAAQAPAAPLVQAAAPLAPAPAVPAAPSAAPAPPPPPAKGPFPVVAPTLQSPPPPAPVAAAAPAPKAAAPAAAPVAPAPAPAPKKRAQEKGLAHDNPFR